MNSITRSRRVGRLLAYLVLLSLVLSSLGSRPPQVARAQEESPAEEEAMAVLSTPLSDGPIVGGQSGEAQPLSAGWTLIMTEDVEGFFPSSGWTVDDNDGTTNGEYYWGDTDYKAHSGDWSAWAADDGADGLDPYTDNYANNMDAWMIYGPFDLSDATDAELQFWFWNESEEDYDYFKWMASTDGTNFHGWINSGDSGGWVYRNFDLTNVPTLGDITGDSSVWIAFIFTSDHSITDKGPFVDDIELWKYVAGPGELVTNGSFETGPRLPAGWKGKRLTSKDRRVCNQDHSGRCSFRMVGNGKNKFIYQVASGLSGAAGDTLTFTAWSKASRATGGGAYRAQAIIYYTDGTRKIVNLNFSKGTHGWQRRRVNITAAKPYNKVKIILRYGKRGGKVWFDDVSLVATP